jgi:hypothetical protein
MMHEDLMQLIERAKVAFPKFGNGVPQATITAAEQALGVPLPDSYKWLLLNYGGGQLKGDIVYGLDEGGMGRPDIVELARLNEQDGLYHIDRLVFCMGNAENFLFDTTRAKNGEYPVLLHDITQDELIPYAESFAEFLRKRIREVYSVSE